MTTYGADLHRYPSSSTLTIADATEVSLTAVALNSQEEQPRVTGIAKERFGGGSVNDAASQRSRPLTSIKEHHNQDDDQQRLTGIDLWVVNPANPRNWSTVRKWRNATIVSFYTLIAPLASSMMAPGLPAIAEHYIITSPTVVALTLSVYVLAWAIGPLFIGPLSEIYGRLCILHISNLFFGIFCLAQIFAPNTAALTAFRFFAGIGGCAPVAIGGSCISDMFNEKERSIAMSMYLLGPLLGPVIGPIVGGFTVQAIGFKYVFVILTVLAGVAALISVPLLEETYAPVIKKRLARKLEASGNPPKIEVAPPPALTHVLRVSLSRPFLLLTRSLICFSLSLYMALTYGYLYLIFTTFPTLFGEIYGWGPGISGLAYLGPGMGFMLSTAVGAPLMSRTYGTLCERNGGKGKPEYRIPTMFIGSTLVPIGLFWYGWSAEARMHWIMPIIGSGIFSFGMMLTFLPIQLYLVDAFTYAASALGAASVLRALFGFAFPLFGQQMFKALGLGGGNSLLACVAIVVGIPFPIWIYFRGERLRARNPLNR